MKISVIKNLKKYEKFLSSSAPTIGRSFDNFSLSAEANLNDLLAFGDSENDHQFYNIPVWTTPKLAFSFYKNDLQFKDFFILSGPVSSQMTFFKIKKSHLSEIKPFFWGGGMVAEVLNQDAFAKPDHKKFWTGTLPYEQIVLLAKHFKVE